MSGNPADIEVADVATALNRNILAVCRKLLPNGTIIRNDWAVGNLNGDRGQSLRVVLSGPKQGTWVEFNGHKNGAKDGLAGDALDLVAAVDFGGNKRDAVRWAISWLGLDGLNPERIQKIRREAEVQKVKAVDQAKRKRGIAHHWWLSAQEKLAGTAGERYFLGRGIDWAALGRQPGCLRFAPELGHPETGELAPAIVAAITNLAGEFVAVHRTFLEPLPDGRVIKLRGVKDAKLTLGTYRSACIRLWRGETGRPLRDAKPGEWLMIGEGIEDTAMGIQGRPDLRAVAEVSGSNIVELPGPIEGVYLLAQNETNVHAVEAFEHKVHAYQKQGKRVRVARIGDGSAKDLAEYGATALARAQTPATTSAAGDRAHPRPAMVDGEEDLPSA